MNSKEFMSCSGRGRVALMFIGPASLRIRIRPIAEYQFRLHNTLALRNNYNRTSFITIIES
jgi:hypothetical protein